MDVITLSYKVGQIQDSLTGMLLRIDLFWNRGSIILLNANKKRLNS